jgi:hypothetical protein
MEESNSARVAISGAAGNAEGAIRQRARLVSSLIDSLEESDEADVEQAWIDEVHKRARELETGQVRGLTWAEARRIMLGT